MADGRQEPYDPYLPTGGAAGAPGAAPQQGNQRTAALQAVSTISFEPLNLPSCRYLPPGPALHRNFCAC